MRIPNLRLSAILVVLLCVPESAAQDANFHLYLLAGQSNMAGRGKVDAESAKSDPRVLMLTKERTWVPAVDPLHFDKDSAGVGPGLAFGKRMAAAYPAVRIGLIPCAVGGTSIARWAPGIEDAKTQTKPYDDMLVRVRTAQTTGVIKGIIWHQGESDRGSADTYGAKLTVLIARMRDDLKAPQVPFVAGELPDFKVDTTEQTKAFNKALNGLKPGIAWFSVVSAEGLADKGDRLHLDAPSARLLGDRYAEAMLALQRKR
jgi:hypothetical protein